MAAEVPLQANFLTGEFVDKRTRQQKQRDQERERPTQIEMFSQREVAQFGVRANPQLSLSEHTKLVLIAHDPRTAEEIERDRERAAQALTIPFFAKPTAEPASDTVKPTVTPSVDELFSPPAYPLLADEVNDRNDEYEEEAASTVQSPKLTKIVAYTQLARIVKEWAATLYASPTVAIAQAITVAIARSEAKQAGLSETEIQTAIQIGEFRGKAEKPVPIQPKPAVVNSSVPIGEYGVLWLHGRNTPLMEMVKI